MKKDKRGGSRDGAGRPKKYGEPTTIVHFRVPESQKSKVSEIVKNFLRKCNTKSK